MSTSIMAVTFEGMREDENSVTVWGRDDNDVVHSETVTHDGSDFGRSNAIDDAIEGALNH